MLKQGHLMTTTEFVPPYALSTPVLLIVFKRFDTTKHVFEAIRKAKVPKLYIASDGARENIKGEFERVNEIRRYLLQNVDWDCEVRTLFSDVNQGCMLGESNAMNWFFKQEEMGIVLEDDCLPRQSFFWFCEELLEKYRSDMRVGHISGNHFQTSMQRGTADYYFSVYNHCWGWASWADRWKSYDVNLDNVENTDFINGRFSNKKTRDYWVSVFRKMKAGKSDTWDYQWTFCLWVKNYLTIIPNKNLIKNIGFGADATHTFDDSEFSNLDTEEISILNHPTMIVRDYEADEFTSQLMYRNRHIIFRIIGRFKRIILRC